MTHTYKCFYCENDIEPDHVHIVNLYDPEHPQDERLCDQCYAEWLEGIKE